MTAALFTPLTDLQEAFVVEYLVDYNASAAARRAGYSPKTHGAQSAALMKNPAVRARIDVGIKAMRERIGVCAMNAWQELARAAFFDVRKALDKNDQVLPVHEMDEDTASALIFSSRTLKGGEKVTSLRQPSRLTALLALERRFAKEEEIERQVLKDEAERQAAEDEKTARERRYKPEHTQVKEAEARQAQQRELDALRAERDALAEQVKAVKLPETPVQAPRRPFAAAPAAPAQAATRKAEATQVAPAKVAAMKVAPAKAAPAGPGVSAKEQARRALDALFEPVPVPVPAVEVPAPAPGVVTLPVLELLTDVKLAAAQTVASIRPEAPVAPRVATQVPANAAAATGAASAPEPVAAHIPAVPVVAVDARESGGGHEAGPVGGPGAGSVVGDHANFGELGDDAGYEEDGDGDEVDDYPDILFTVPAPAPEPAPAPIKRRNINLWGESTDFPRKSAPEKEPVVPGSNWPEGFVLRAGGRVPAPWETFAGGPKPPGIVKDPRPQFAVGAGEFQWSDEYLEDGES